MAKKELVDLASQTIDLAKQAGANACSVSINANRQVSISQRNHKPENIMEASSRSMTVRFYVDGRYSSQTTSDLRPVALKPFVTNAVSTTRLLAEDPDRSLPDPKYYEDMPRVKLDIVDPAYDAWTPERRLALVQALEDATLSQGGDRVITASAFARDSRGGSLLLTSNGFEGYEDYTFYVAGSDLTVRDEGDRLQTGNDAAVTFRQGEIPDPEKLAAETVRRTLRQLGSRKIATETLPIIVENRVASNLLNALLQAMSGYNIHQKQSFLLDKKGKSIGSTLFTLIDDPLVPRGLSSQLFDSEGLPGRRRVMIDAGVLREFYVGWYYSRKLKCEPTTSDSTNLIIPPGKRSVEEIMKDLGRGILVTNFIGGNSNATTGDASVGIEGQLFEKGLPTQAVAEMNIAGNQLEFWQRLAEVANDPYLYSSARLPSLVFNDVVVSGA